MFQPGELIFYGSMGVCRVNKVSVPPFLKPGEEKEYYLLEPLDQPGEIYIPVDSKVYMRPVVKKEEADRLIDLIPSMRAEAYDTPVMQELTRHYSAAMDAHGCEELIRMIMSIYEKKRNRQQKNQKFGVVDETYMKRGEELLYTEFSVALGIPKTAVQSYIAARVRAAEKQVQKTEKA